MRNEERKNTVDLGKVVHPSDVLDRLLSTLRLPNGYGCVLCCSMGCHAFNKYCILSPKTCANETETCTHSINMVRLTTVQRGNFTFPVAPTSTVGSQTTTSKLPKRHQLLSTDKDRYDGQLPKWKMNKAESSKKRQKNSIEKQIHRARESNGTIHSQQYSCCARARRYGYPFF